MTRIAAEKIRAVRARIKTHVRHKGENSDFDITETFCAYWWHMLNDAVFDGILTPPVRFELRNFRYDLGWCKPWRPNASNRRVVIGISTDLYDRKMFLSVLAHEMVHQWEWEVAKQWLPRYPHGATFFSWRTKLKSRVGLPLETTY